MTESSVHSRKKVVTVSHLGKCCEHKIWSIEKGKHPLINVYYFIIHTCLNFYTVLFQWNCSWIFQFFRLSSEEKLSLHIPFIFITPQHPPPPPPSTQMKGPIVCRGPCAVLHCIVYLTYDSLTVTCRLGAAADKLRSFLCSQYCMSAGSL